MATEVQYLTMLEPDQLSLRELVNHVSQSRLAAETRLHHFEMLEAATRDSDSTTNDLYREQVASLRASIKEMDDAIRRVFYSNPIRSGADESASQHSASHRPKTKKARARTQGPRSPRLFLAASSPVAVS